MLKKYLKLDQTRTLFGNLYKNLLKMNKGYKKNKKNKKIRITIIKQKREDNKKKQKEMIMKKKMTQQFCLIKKKINPFVKLTFPYFTKNYQLIQKIMRSYNLIAN